jgi:hypothetical protein
MRSYPIGYRVAVFFYGDKTLYEYAGAGEWRFISGCNSPARYEQLLELINQQG